MTSRERIAAILSEILGVPIDAAQEYAREQAENWDSLNHLRIVLAFEEEFGVSLQPEEVVAVRCLSVRLALVQGKGGPYSSPSVLFERDRGGQAQATAFALEDHSLLGEICFVCISGVVKGGPADHFKGQRTTHYRHRTNDVMVLISALSLLDGHEVGDFTNAINSEEARDEDIGFW